MRIGAFSRRTGVSPRLLRYYEDQGLLTPRRRSSGYREYDDADITTVATIRTLLAAGLGTRTIAELLPCVFDEDGEVVPGCSGLLPDLERERARLDDAMAALAAARVALDRIIAATPAAGSEDTEDCVATNVTAHA